MDKIYTNKDFKKKMVESALNGEVKESHDQNGKYFEKGIYKTENVCYN